MSERTRLPRVTNEVPGESPMDALVDGVVIESPADESLGNLYVQNPDEGAVATPHMDGKFSTINQTIATNGSRRYYGVDADGKNRQVSASAILENYGHAGDYQGQKNSSTSSQSPESGSDQKSSNRFRKIGRKVLKFLQADYRDQAVIDSEKATKSAPKPGQDSAVEKARKSIADFDKYVDKFDRQEDRRQKLERGQKATRKIGRKVLKFLQADYRDQAVIDAEKATKKAAKSAPRQPKTERTVKRGGLRQDAKDYFKYRKLSKQRQAYHAETDRLETKTLTKLYEADKTEAKDSERVVAGKLIEFAWNEALRAEAAGDEEAVQMALKAAELAQSLEILREKEQDK